MEIGGKTVFSAPFRTEGGGNLSREFLFVEKCRIVQNCVVYYTTIVLRFSISLDIVSTLLGYKPNFQIDTYILYSLL